ncbi:flagellar protein FlaG [Vogesella facilis]|uniref:Flagellar protein FlaG n=1 Tax=Vogesella facilis TaxID=1655232 RepID=A0ABV7RCD8_9NEIS
MMNILGNLPGPGVLPGSSSNAADLAARSQTSAAVSSGAVAVSPQAVQAAGATDKGRNTAASDDELRKAVEKVSSAMQAYGRELNFSIDEDSGIQVVKVMDTSNDEVIRQFPSEEVLRIAKNLDKVLGVLFEERA